MRKEVVGTRNKLSFTVDTDTYDEFTRLCDQAHISREKYLAEQLVAFAHRHEQKGLTNVGRQAKHNHSDMIKFFEEMLGESASASPVANSTPAERKGSPGLKEVRINIQSTERSRLVSFFDAAGVDRNRYIQASIEQLNERLKDVVEVLWGQPWSYNGDGGDDDDEDAFFEHVFLGEGPSEKERSKLKHLMERFSAKLDDDEQKEDQ